MPISEIPETLQKAVIAAEDKDFYSHSGFSVKGIFRSVVLDLTHKSLSFGGSTITQQLVKNSMLNPTKSFLRKYQVLILANEIERRYSKAEVLEMYLNSVYFGEGAFGVEEAAQVYFGKHVKDLDLAEESLIVALLPSPSRLSPLSGDLKETKRRQGLILEKMVEQKYVSKSDAEDAKKEELKFSEDHGNLNTKAPHFALYVKQLLVDKFGEERISRSGFKIKTSIDLDLQEYAQELVKLQVEKLKGNRVSNGGAVVIEPNSGEVRVMVGSVDWYNDDFGKVNIATSLRQPGSVFKPIVYASALEKRLITPATVLKDESVTYNTRGSPPYKPVDFDRKFRGLVLVRRALANSLNVPSVEVMDKVGVPAALEMAKKLGLTTLDDPDRYGLSLVLGAAEVKLLEMVGVYATLANLGERVESVALTKIIDKRGSIVFEYKPKPERVLQAGNAYQIASILSDSQTRAEEFGSALNISHPAAVKTGTTEDFRDSWTFGYTPSVAIGVWVGNNDNKPMDNIAGALGAAPIWKSLMEKFLQGRSVEKFAVPAEIITLSVCRFNGLKLTEATSSGYTEYFIRGTEPTKPCITLKPTMSVIPSPSGSASPSPVFTSLPE